MAPLRHPRQSKKVAPKRQQRAHGTLPAGFTWRDGRPRWIPQPNQRKLGWKGVNLQDNDGAYLAMGPAVNMAVAINEAFRAWLTGSMVPAEFANFAPAGSAMTQPADEVAADMQIGYFIDQWIGVADDEGGAWKIAPSREFMAKASGTRRDYKNKLGRLIDAIAGFAELPLVDDAKAKAEHQAAVATVRRLSIMTLEPVQTDGAELFDPLYEAYWNLHRHAGINMASGVLAVASVWLNWINKRRRREVVNWAAKVERETPPGRIRPGTIEEIRTLVEIGDAQGYEDVVDALILSLDLSWSQIDVLQLVESKVVDYRCFTARQKTGRVGGTPLTFIGRRRYDIIMARRRAEPVTPLMAADRHIVRLKREKDTKRRGIEADSDLLRKRFAELRAAAAAKRPSLATFQFADARDTAITWARKAKLSTDEMASRTLQSRQNIQSLHDKHYGEIDAEVADEGRDQLEIWYKANGISF